MNILKSQLIIPFLFVLFVVLAFKSKTSSTKQCNINKRQIIIESADNAESWRQLEIDSLGSFIFPGDKLEIQSKKIIGMMDSLRKIIKINTTPTRFVLQQKGFNDFKNLKYVRVIVETYNGQGGNYLKGSSKIREYTKVEQNQIKTAYKNSIINNFKTAGFQILKWYPVELQEINGSFCIVLKFDRKALTKGEADVHVRLYSFPNNKRQFDLTMACRVDDVVSWGGDFDKIIKSFSLSNKVRD